MLVSRLFGAPLGAAPGGVAAAIGGTLVSVVARGLVAGGAPLGAAGAGGPVAEACAAACAAGAS